MPNDLPGVLRQKKKQLTQSNEERGDVACLLKHAGIQWNEPAIIIFLEKWNGCFGKVEDIKLWLTRDAKGVMRDFYKLYLVDKVF